MPAARGSHNAASIREGYDPNAPEKLWRFGIDDEDREEVDPGEMDGEDDRD